jgi:hypothetical protein
MFTFNRLLQLSFLAISASLSACILFTQTPYTAANCAGFDGEEFGDAPDQAPTGYTAPGAATGAFPSRRSSDGPRAQVRCRYWIGEYVTVENGYTDPGDPDPINPRGRPPGSNVPNITSDYDDGVTYDWLIAAQSTPDRLPAKLNFRVQVNSIGRHDVVFNVLVDANRDGDWKDDSPVIGAGEWAVRNHQVSLREGFVTYDMPPIDFPIASSGMPNCMWARVTISDQPLGYGQDQAWTGTGAIGEGEIEDILVIGANGATCTVLQPEN